MQNHNSKSADVIGLECANVSWLVWFLARSKLDLRSFVFGCADRAVRAHAPKALRKAGLNSAAEKLEALPPIMDEGTARAEQDTQLAELHPLWTSWARGD